MKKNIFENYKFYIKEADKEDPHADRIAAIRAERDRLQKLFMDYHGKVKSETGFIAGGDIKKMLASKEVELSPTFEKSIELNIPKEDYIVKFFGERANVLRKQGSWQVAYSGQNEQAIIEAAKKILEISKGIDISSKY
jgi:hypothetical protein